jgi:hypothetical protein
MENHGGMMLTEGNFCFVVQKCLAIPPAESYGCKQEEWAMRIWPCEVFLFILANDIYLL